jgi:hypothetical protein
MQADIVEDLRKEGRLLEITGDGQFDSPGYSARQGSIYY